MRQVAKLALALLAIAAFNGPAPAQDYPNRSITLLVPLAPGGGMDFIARTVGAKLSERIGKPVLVENRPGGGTIVATVALAKAPPDGYTLLLVPAPTLTTNAVVYKSLPYDPIKDFAPIALTSQVSFTLVVNPALPVHSVADLIKYAKEKPGELIAGTSGLAGVPHLAAELLAHKTGTKIRSVHYRGSPPALNDVIAGHVHMMFADPVTGTALAKDGKVRALAVSSKSRLSVYPELPPIAEAGVPGYEVTTWHMVIAPAQTPPAVVQKLSAEIRAVVALPEVQQQINKMGLEPLESPPPAGLRKFLDAEIEVWGKVVQEIGLAGSM
jgi:tripartite-type tricarboxylate transporter receptor subunit TctC